MARSFVARADSRFMCTLEPDESAVIMQVAQEVIDVIRLDLGLVRDQGEALDALATQLSDDPLTRLEHESRSTEAPRDTAVQRLLPPASERDTVAEEFRRFSQRGIAESHIENVGAIIAALSTHRDLAEGRGEIIIDRDEALHWLKGLTALRLVLGDRMNIRDDGDFEALTLLCSSGIDMESERAEGMASLEYLASLYEFLSWLQSSLIDALNSRG